MEGFGFDPGKIMSMFGDFQKINDNLMKELENKEISSSVGGGMVKITINGLGNVKSVFIDEEIFKTGDKEMLEDLLRAAVQSLFSQTKSTLKETFTSSLLSNFPINNLFGTPEDNEDK